MRSAARGRSVRVVGLGLVALLVVGGIVGAAVLDDTPSDDDQALTVADGPAAERSTGANASVANGSVASTGAGVTAAPMPFGETSASDGIAGGSAGGGGGPAPAPEALPPIDAGRVIKTATLQLEMDEKGFDAAHDRALSLVANAGGFVQNSNLRPDRATLTFRVPADKFEAALADLRALGEVKDEVVTGEDVSEEYVDLEARLRHWRAQEAVFLELLTKAKSVAETVEIRRELSTIQQTIEQLEGRIRFLDDRTGFSTVTLEMFVPGAGLTRPEESTGPSLSEAWEDAWDAAVTVVGGTLITLGVLIPLGAIVGLVVLVAWLALRRRRSPVPNPAT